jgi:hypothetical protein
VEEGLDLHDSVVFQNLERADVFELSVRMFVEYFVSVLPDIVGVVT